MPNLGPTELIIIGVVLVLLFGATRLPQTAKGLGQALKIFKKEIRDEDKPQADAPPQPIDQTANAASANGTGQAAAQPVEDSERTTR
ncbi:twin-arginine translocase TatA/TatE family subunit [Actinopolymorpha sp. B11F2]|uniref:twin-arginine translocase TatA/TatE family subunit n=1 Tax=Actinopolymorpha sp. B11F2 TaxID=3160862 RepID=UPI0032E369EA